MRASSSTNALVRFSTQSLTRSAVQAGRRVPKASHIMTPSQSMSSSRLGLRRFSVSHSGLAEATTSHSSFRDPAADESQKQLEAGTTALEAGDVAGAKQAYERAIGIQETASAHFNLGVCHYHDKDVEKAIEAWKNAIKLSPEAADAHTNLASAYVMSSPTRPDLAVEHLKTAAQITPEDPEVQFNLGAVLEACEQLEEAIKAYERAREGGIERALENARNCKAKILAVKVGLGSNAGDPPPPSENEKKQD